MSRIAIISYTAGSESANILRDSINESLGSPLRARILRQEGTLFRGRSDDFILNWGSARAIPSNVMGNATLINNPINVNNAGNKITALNMMRDNGISTVDFTTNYDEARRWVDNGEHVFVRNELRGHSGTGIVCVSDEEPEALGNVDHSHFLPQRAPLYTKGVTGLHREFRVHVFNGEVIFTQQKRRASGYRDNPNYSNVVRNHGNGWIYAHNNIATPNDSCIENALKAVSALGLDFGAVDVLTHQDQAWVLEVNTAPGQTGQTTRQRYVDAITNVYNNGLSLTTPIDQPIGEALAASISIQSEIDAITLTTPTADLIASTPIWSGRNLPLDEMPSQVTFTTPEWTQASTLDQIPLGTTVRLSPQSTFYSGNLPSRSNPTDTDGVISAVHAPWSSMNISVRWSNGIVNTYNCHDLMIKQPEVAVVDAPVEVAVEPTVTSPVMATPTPITTPSNLAFYKAVIDNENTIVQYHEAIQSYFMVGFDMPLEAASVTLIEQITFS